MRANIVLDDKLMADVMELGGFSNEQAAIEYALRLLLQKEAQRRLSELGGKVEWEGDLDDMRTSKDGSD